MKARIKKTGKKISGRLAEILVKNGRAIDLETEKANEAKVKKMNEAKKAKAAEKKKQQTKTNTVKKAS